MNLLKEKLNDHPKFINSNIEKAIDKTSYRFNKTSDNSLQTINKVILQNYSE